MDDLAHELPLNHRKRKAGNDDRATAESQDAHARAASEGLLVDTSAPANSKASGISPRLPWLAGGNTIWSSPSSPSTCSPVSPESEYDTYPTNPPKRQRLDAMDSSSSGLTEVRCKTPARVPNNAIRYDSKDDAAEVTLAPYVDCSSPHIPPLKPPINRQTLQELDLDSIIQNPQLRHDLLVEPRLQFRPTHSRRKRDATERYWASLLQELEDGCTCTTFDVDGKHRSRICACALIPPCTTAPITAFLPVSKAYTVCMPSRIRPFLCEFLAVLQLVVQPLTDLSSLTADHGSLKMNVHEHSAQTTYIWSMFDPALIEQEIKRNLFDPSGLLQAIGHLLKEHCAPMRDSAVDEMIQAASACAVDGKLTIGDALGSFRMCMELFEIMKLDIANHQLQSLRPYLARTSGQYELKMFQSRLRSLGGLRKTQAWLQKVRTAILAQQQSKLHRLRPPETQLYPELSTNQQIHLAVLTGLVDLAFIPPTDLANEATSPPRSDRPSTAAYPETLYLDSKRLAALSLEAADLMALYLSLLLYRQLVQSKSQTGSETRLPVATTSRLRKLKEELRAVAGSRLVYCFLRKHPNNRQDTLDKRVDRCVSMREDIMLQITKHAHTTLMRVSRMDDHIRNNDAPDEQMLNLARNWVTANFHPDSPLSVLARDRLRDVVLDAVIRAVAPKQSASARKFMELRGRSGDELMGKNAGTEPLIDEVCVLAHKIARLASVHLGTYLPLYEQEGFLSP